MKHQPLLIGALLVAGCDLTVQAGDKDGGVELQMNLPRGASCRPGSAASNPCAANLFCDYSSACNIKIDAGCYTEGTCTPKKELGQTCRDKSDCAEALANCRGTSSSPYTCQVSSADLDAQRCEQSAQCSSIDGIRRVCEQTYCKRLAGEKCDENDQCVSGRCSSAINARCL
ncbi:MAG: hypothetical protein K1X64_11410 [Myxococcaceae bacterium]|nr:hypothetical protein [Myxococcaceae bacterium]